MSNIRKQIRDKIVDLLKESALDSELRVYGDRIKSLKSNEYPSIVVFCRSESSEVLEDGPRSYVRTLQCIIEGCIRVSLDDQNSADDKLEDMAAQIEEVLYANPRLDDLANGAVLNSKLVRTEIEFATNGELPIGVVQLTYEILYQSN